MLITEKEKKKGRERESLKKRKSEREIKRYAWCKIKYFLINMFY